MSTRVVNMQTELNLPSISERIASCFTMFTVKCLHSPQIVPHYSQVIRTSLDPRSRLPPLQPGGRTLVKTVCSILRRLDVVVPQEDIVPGPPPWLLPIPRVCYTPTSKTAPPTLQRQLALETIASVQASYHLYTDGPLLSGGKAGSAVFSLDRDPPRTIWCSRCSQPPLSTGYQWSGNLRFETCPTVPVLLNSCLSLFSAPYNQFVVPDA